VIEDALRAHADAVARRVRHDGYQGRTVTLKIKLGRPRPGRASARGPRYPLLSRSRTLPEPTDDGSVIGRVAVELFHDAGVHEPVRLLGVSLTGLEWWGVGGAPQQLSLFDRPSKRDPLGPALDAITQRFGVGAIRRAVVAPGKVTHGRGIKRGES
jgi:DNA polymerase-4